MFYKVLPGNDLFVRLEELKVEMKRCNDVALHLVESIGYKSFRLSWQGIAGGISAIKIQGGCPHGWKKATKKDPDAYLPSNIQKNQKLLQEIEELPIVQSSQLNEILKFEEYLDGETHVYIEHPFVRWKEGVVLIKISEVVKGYEPLPNMIEITSIEYKEIAESSPVC